MPNDHAARINNELVAAGMTKFGTLKFSSHYLPHIIHENEHIKAVVYGRHKEGEGPIMLSEVMLIATDQRVIFLDHKPGYTSVDELAYDIISGVNMSTAALFSSITLYTKIAAITIRFANKKCVEQFVEYIEKRRIQSQDAGRNSPSLRPFATALVSLSPEAIEFLESRSTGVLSTVDRMGMVHGAAIHYVLGENNVIYFLTRAESAKAHNLILQSQLALTVYDAESLQTVQLDGYGEFITDEAVKEEVRKRIVGPRRYGKSYHFAPVMALEQGNFIVVKINIGSFHYHDYSKETEVSPAYGRFLDSTP